MEKNLEKLMSHLHKLVLVEIGIITIALALLGKSNWILSILLGCIFSYIGFLNLIKSQTQIIKQKNKNKAFLALLNRLAYFAIPVIIAIRFPVYVNIGIVIASIWVYQINFIILEFTRSLKKVKAKQKT